MRSGSFASRVRRRGCERLFSLFECTHHVPSMSERAAEQAEEREQRRLCCAVTSYSSGAGVRCGSTDVSEIPMAPIVC